MMDEVRLSEEIPVNPPDDPVERESMLWKMVRENYRITKQYDRMTQRAKWLASSVVGFLLTLLGLFAFWEWFRGVLKRWIA